MEQSHHCSKPTPLGVFLYSFRKAIYNPSELICPLEKSALDSEPAQVWMIRVTGFLSSAFSILTGICQKVHPAGMELVFRMFILQGFSLEGHGLFFRSVIQRVLPGIQNWGSTCGRPSHPLESRQLSWWDLQSWLEHPSHQAAMPYF